MKILTLVFFIFGLVSYSQGLDKIYLKNSEVVVGTILKVTSENIEINTEGDKAFKIIKRKNARVIIYSDNTVVTLQDSEETDNIDLGVNLEILIDERDGQEYKIGKIGNQIWMLENLNYKIDGSHSYEENENNRDLFGLLYDESTASIVCPKGWHLPDDSDWRTLIHYLGNKSIAGGKMKETGTQYWFPPNVASNESGFSALPAGSGFKLARDIDIRYENRGELSFFWIFEDFQYGDDILNLGSRHTNAMYRISTDGNKDFPKYYCSCRCIKD